MGMNGDYTFCIGDYGAGNTTANPWSSNHFNIRYVAAISVRRYCTVCMIKIILTLETSLVSGMALFI
jgi:hypothetical protein